VGLFLLITMDIHTEHADKSPREYALALLNEGKIDFDEAAEIVADLRRWALISDISPQSSVRDIVRAIKGE
jgi:hypothetical protein